MKQLISMDKKYRTRDKGKGRLLCNDRKAFFPVLFLKDNGNLITANKFGSYLPDGEEHPDDLIEFKPSIYIAGPMTGLEYFNAPAFDAAAEYYRDLGWNVINPVDLDEADTGVNVRDLPADTDWHAMPDGLDIDSIIRRDFEAVMRSDAIALLPGWQESVGACAELRLACWRGIEARSFEEEGLA